MSAQLIIFDCDGVLVDSEPITNRVLAEDLTRHGLEMTTERCIDLFVGGTMNGVAIRARELGADLPGDWVERFYDIMCTALAEEVMAIPGIHDTFDALDQAQIPYCVASNGPMRKMRITLARVDLWHRVDGRIFSAHEVGIAKPDPGLFLHAARTLDAAPADCIVVEDSASGARAARAAGMRCLGYVADTPAHRLTGEGAETFERMEDLAGLLGL